MGPKPLHTKHTLSFHTARFHFVPFFAVHMFAVLHALISPRMLIRLFWTSGFYFRHGFTWVRSLLGPRHWDSFGSFCSLSFAMDILWTLFLFSFMLFRRVLLSGFTFLLPLLHRFRSSCCACCWFLLDFAWFIYRLRFRIK